LVAGGGLDLHLRFAQIEAATSVCTGGWNCPPDSSSAMGSNPHTSHLEKKKAIPFGMTFSFLARRTEKDIGCLVLYAYVNITGCGCDLTFPT